MSADSVYHYGTYAILGASLPGAARWERVSSRTRAGAHTEIAVTLAMSLWENATDDTASGATKRKLPLTFRGDLAPKLII